MTHLCHAYKCPEAVPPSMLMCRKHWSMVSPINRRLVWATYRRGQEEDKDASPEWHAAADYAIAEVAAAEGFIVYAETKAASAKRWEEIARAERRRPGTNCVAVVCTNCGNTILVNLVVAGIMTSTGVVRHG